MLLEINNLLRKKERLLKQDKRVVSFYLTRLFSIKYNKIMMPIIYLLIFLMFISFISGFIFDNNITTTFFFILFNLFCLFLIAKEIKNYTTRKRMRKIRVSIRNKIKKIDINLKKLT